MKNKSILFLILTAASLQCPPAFGQNNKVDPEQMRRMHNEKPDDPYAPNAYNNQRTSPGYRYTNRVKSSSLHSSIYTVQVNVNSLGQNIIGDAANEPSIAVNPVDRNQMVIGWRQFDNVTNNFRQAGWGYTTNRGVNWTFPGVIDPGIFRSDPVLDFDANGNFYYNSLTNDPDYFCKVYKSTNGGAAWDAGTEAHGGDKQWMVIDRSATASRGNIYAFWSYYFSTCAPGFSTRSTNDNTRYEDCFVVDGNPYWGTMAVGNEGELYVGGTAGVQDSLVVAKSMNAREKDSLVTWNKPVSVYIGGSPNGWSGVNPGGLLGQVSIDVDHSDGPGRGYVYVLAPVTKSSGDPCDVMFARSIDGGLHWSYPVRVNDDPSETNSQWFGTMSVSPDGRIDAIWLDTRDAPAGSDSSALYYSFSTDQGETWSVNEKLSGTFDPHVGYPNQNKMGDYFDMVSDSAGANLSWANTFNGEQDVYYSRIIPYVSTGISDIAQNASISVYPNPVTGTMIIKGLATDCRIDVYSAIGEKLQSANSYNTTCEIDISTQPGGIYFLKIVDQNGEAVIKKVVKR